MLQLFLISKDTLTSTLNKSFPFLRLWETHASLFGNLDFQIGLLLLFFTLNFWLFADYSLWCVLQGQAEGKKTNSNNKEKHDSLKDAN